MLEYLGAIKEDKLFPSRFLKKVKKDPNTGCWEWQGSKAGKGYGQLRWPTGKDKMEYAHRISAMVKYGKTSLDTTDYVCHVCDNISCCNPEHLFIGTPKDNIQDSIAKGRFKMPPDHNGCKHKEGYCKYAKQSTGEI